MAEFDDMNEKFCFEGDEGDKKKLPKKGKNQSHDLLEVSPRSCSA